MEASNTDLLRKRKRRRAERSHGLLFLRPAHSTSSASGPEASNKEKEKEASAFCRPLCAYEVLLGKRRVAPRLNQEGLLESLCLPEFKRRLKPVKWVSADVVGDTVSAATMTALGTPAALAALLRGPNARCEKSRDRVTFLCEVARDSSVCERALAYNACSKKSQDALQREEPSQDLFGVLPPEMFPFKELVWLPLSRIDCAVGAANTDADTEARKKQRTSLMTWGDLSTCVREDTRSLARVLERNTSKTKESTTGSL